MSTPAEMLERYRAAFTRGEVGALLDCFAFPLHVVSVTDGEAASSVADSGEWPGVLERLLGAYRRLSVTDCAPQAVDVTEPMDAVAVVRVQWVLRRADGDPVYDFTAVYTMARVEGALRIVAIAHDELPKMQAAMERPGRAAR